MPESIPVLIWWLFGLSIATIGLFVKRMIDQLDRIQQAQSNFASKQELADLRSDCFRAIQDLRTGEVSELHEIMRDETKQLRDEITGVANRLSDKIDEKFGLIQAHLMKAAKNEARP